MKTNKIIFATVCVLLFLSLIPLQAQTNDELRLTIDQLKAKNKSLEEKNKTLEAKLKKCQRKTSSGDCSELEAENQRLTEEANQLRIDLKALSSSSNSKKTTLDIKDPVFKAYLLRYCDMDNDGEITTYDAEHTYVIDCSKGRGNFWNGESPSIYSLEGIEAFINLKKLICSGNEIRLLDLKNNTLLEILEADGCSLKVLTINENTELKWLSCKNNALREIDLSNNPNLAFLDVSYNELNIISLNNNPKLAKFYCANNGLVSIMASNNDELTLIDCSNNELNSLDLSNTAADSIMCQNNRLNFLDLRNERTISYLDCSKNKNLEEVLISNNHYVVTSKNKKIHYK